MPDHSRYSPLLDPGWRHIEKISLEEFDAADWELLNRQRGEYYAREQARQVLGMLAQSACDPSFGYLVNNYGHCLQSATMAQRDGLPEEDVVVCLLHDIGFVACPDMHAEFAAALLGAYISERNYWMLLHHAVFQQFHIRKYPGLDPNERERWRGHPHFEWTATFVDRYDQAANDPGYDRAPLDAFEPMVQRLFARTPRPRRAIDGKGT